MISRPPDARSPFACGRSLHLPIIERARVELFGDHKAADVVVGVASLSPDYLIEVDAIAVIDDAA